MSTETRSAAGDIASPFFARLYHHVLAGSGPRGKDLDHRRELLTGLSGTVVEVGPGNGPNFALYPTTVERVIAVEPEPYLRTKAARAAARASVPIEVSEGHAELLPLEDGQADAVVLALVLCSVPDQARALAEARRVLAPGGQLRIYEHVVARNRFAKALQWVAQVTFWRRAFGNCHPTRDTLAALTAAGFDTSGIRRFVLLSPAEPPLPHILGTAVPT